MRFTQLLSTLLFPLIVAVGCTKDPVIALADVEDVCTEMEDLAFMKYCYDKFDINRDGKVSMSEAAAAKEIIINGKEITSLKGIQYFSHLEILECSENKISSLELSNNRKLRVLRCYTNQISSLDLKNNRDLEDIYCGGNFLRSINVNTASSLKNLNCCDNSLSSIDVKDNAQLEGLICGNNKIHELNISRNPNLSNV